jgi:glycosyltransferase involved in cell wall biosynthesis
MKLSVAVPTYKRAPLLLEALESVLAQTRQPDEIVVSDNASPDDTAARVRALAERHPQIKLVVQPRNLGGVPNWNAAVAGCSGDLLALCFDDDLWDKDHLARSLDALAARPSCDLVFGAFRTLATQADGATKLLDWPRRPAATLYSGADAVTYLIRRYSWPFHPSSLVFRRALWEATGPFDPQWQLADTDWFLRASQHGRLDYLPEEHVVDRRHGQNWSNDVGAVEMSREVNRMVHAHLRRLSDSGTPKPAVLGLSRLWAAHQSLHAARLLVARGRAGALDACTGSLQLLLEELPGGDRVPGLAVAALGGLACAALSRLQKALPGGQSRYSGIGVSMPK